MKCYLYKIFFLCFTCILSTQTVIAQQNIIDSLQKTINNYKKIDTLQVNRYQLLAEEYQKSRKKDLAFGTAIKTDSLAKKINYPKGHANALLLIGLLLKDAQKADTAVIVLQQANELNRKIKDTTNLARGILNLGVIYHYQKHVDSLAILYYDSAIFYHQKAKKLTGVANTYNYLGIFNAEKGNYPKTIDCYLKAVRNFEQANDKASVAMMNNNLGNFYRRQGNFPNALKHLEIGLAIRKDLKKWLDVAFSYSNIANVYKETKQDQKALQFYNQALALGDSLKDDFVVGMVLNNRCDLLIKEGKIDLALADYTKALTIFEKLNRKSATVEILNNLAKTYTKKGNTVKALELAQKGLKMAKESKLKPDQRELYHTLAEIYAQKKDYQQAYNFHQLYTAIKDSIFTDESSKKIAEMQTIYETDKKQAHIELLTKETELQKAENEAHRFRRLLFLGVGAILLIIALFLLRNNQLKQRANKVLLTKNAEINQQKEEIEAIAENLKEANSLIESQKNSLVETLELVQVQKHEIEEINKDMTASINYAKRIQRAMLPFAERIEKNFGKDNFFVLYKPRNIVSGDFYWFYANESFPYNNIFIVADCTGHGVPGAFMSMIGMNILDEVVIAKHITQPNLILTALHKSIRYSLKQAETSVRDGMDIAVVSLKKQVVESDLQTNLHIELQFSGAMNPVYYVQNQILTELKATKKPIGGSQLGEETDREFDLQTLNFELNKQEKTENSDLQIYLCTDGFQDQFGGSQNRKFMTKKMKELLASISTQDMSVQHQILDTTITGWIAEGNEHQTDDITIVGLKI